MRRTYILNTISVWKYLKPFKKLTTIQQASCIFRINFACSNWLHFHSVYLIAFCKQNFIIVPFSTFFYLETILVMYSVWYQLDQFLSQYFLLLPHHELFLQLLLFGKNHHHIIGKDLVLPIFEVWKIVYCYLWNVWDQDWKQILDRNQYIRVIMIFFWIRSKSKKSAHV